MREDILERKKEILEWISLKQPKAYICRELKCKEDTLNSWLKKMGIEYSGNMGLKGLKSDPKKKTALEYAKLSYCKSDSLKKKLIEEGYMKNICLKCKNEGEWMGESISLELDHIDGNRFNNDLDNLRILCPNCHSQTPTFRGRGRSKNIKHNSNKCVDCNVDIEKRSTRCRQCNTAYRWPKDKK